MCAHSVIFCFRSIPMRMRSWKERIIGSVVEHPLFPRIITANRLTYSRFALAVVILLFMFFGLYQALERSMLGYLCIGCAIAYGFVSDLFDGPIARKRGDESQYGAFIDSFADKFFALTLAVYYDWLYDPLLIVVLITGEVVSQTLRLWFGQHGQDMRANILGQLKVWAQAAAIFVFYFGDHINGDRILWLALGIGFSGLVFQAREYGLFYSLFRRGSYSAL